MIKSIYFPVALALVASGCGTFIPGPRYKVTVEDFTFNYDGSGVVYLEDRCRFFPLLLRHREKHYLYLYNREGKKHRFIAKTDAFSVSPFGPLILYASPWQKRFKGRGKVPDFCLLDYSSGARRGFFMPDDFRDDYLSYGFPYVNWEEGGSLTAYVNFLYCPGEKPTGWKKHETKPPDWNTELWEVGIEPSEAGDKVAGAERIETEELPKVLWKEIRERKFVSPDGRTELYLSKYGDYFSFYSDLFTHNRETGGKEYIVKENLVIGLAQSGKYSLYFILLAPLMALYGLICM